MMIHDSEDAKAHVFICLLPTFSRIGDLHLDSHRVTISVMFQSRCHKIESVVCFLRQRDDGSWFEKPGLACDVLR
jgi:hypothetical protein